MYIIVSVFHRPAAVVPGPNDVAPAKILAFNMFENGTAMVSIIKYTFQQL